jgi:hypothetical protein
VPTLGVIFWPIIECTTNFGNGTCISYFGYFNAGTEPIYAPIGGSLSNSFSPGAVDRGQPTVFAPGRVISNFTVESDCSDPVTWTLNGHTATTGTDTTCIEACCVEVELDICITQLVGGVCPGIAYGPLTACPSDGSCPQEPTVAPTLPPTFAPTSKPTRIPTRAPTTRPTRKPSVSPTVIPTPSANIVSEFALLQTVDNIPSGLGDVVGDDDQAVATAFANSPTAVSVFKAAVASTMGISASDVSFVSATAVTASSTSSASVTPPAPRMWDLKNLWSSVKSSAAEVGSLFSGQSSSASVSLAIQFKVQFVTEGNDQAAVTSAYEAMTSAFSSAVTSGTFTEAIKNQAQNANFTAMTTVSASAAPSVASGPVTVSQHTAAPTEAPTVRAANTASIVEGAVGVTTITATVFGVVFGLYFFVGSIIAFKRTAIANDASKKDHIASLSPFQVLLGAAISTAACAAQLSLAAGLFTLPEHIASLMAVASALVIGRALYFLSSVVYVFAFVNGSSDATLAYSDWALTASTVCLMCVHTEAATYLPWTDSNRKTDTGELYGFPSFASMLAAHLLTVVQAVMMLICSVIALVEVAHYNNQDKELGYVCLLSIGANVLLGGYGLLMLMFAHIDSTGDSNAVSSRASQYEYKQQPSSVSDAYVNIIYTDTDEDTKKKQQKARRRSKELESGGAASESKASSAGPNVDVRNSKLNGSGESGADASTIRRGSAASSNAEPASDNNNNKDKRRRSRASLILDAIEGGSSSDVNAGISPGKVSNKVTSPTSIGPSVVAEAMSPQQQRRMPGSSLRPSRSGSLSSPPISAQTSQSSAPSPLRSPSLSLVGSPPKLTPIETVINSPRTPRTSGAVGVVDSDGNNVIHLVSVGQRLPTRKSVANTSPSSSSAASSSAGAGVGAVASANRRASAVPMTDNF